MIDTIFAKKAGMTAKYTDKGEKTGATVLRIADMKVQDMRTKEKNGYNAARFMIHDLPAGRQGSRSKKDNFREIRTDEVMESGTEVKFEEVFKVGDRVDVAGTMKGKGFTGVVKRWHFKGQPRTHGQSDRERAPGSSGPTTTPGRVLKGKRRSGHMGNVRKMVKNMEILEILPEKREMLIKGAVPGFTGAGWLEVRKAQ